MTTLTLTMESHGNENGKDPVQHPGALPSASHQMHGVADSVDANHWERPVRAI